MFQTGYRLNILYENKDLYNILAKKGKEKFTQKKYSWPIVAKEFEKIFLTV